MLKIGFIGGGKMAQALCKGFLAAGKIFTRCQTYIIIKIVYLYTLWLQKYWTLY